MGQNCSIVHYISVEHRVVKVLANFIVLANSAIDLVNQVFHVGVYTDVHLVVSIVLVLLCKDIKLVLPSKHVFHYSLELLAILALGLVLMLYLNRVIVHLVGWEMIKCRLCALNSLDCDLLLALQHADTLPIDLVSRYILELSLS